MVTIQRSKFGILKIAEIYFAESPQVRDLRTDIVMFVRCGMPGPGLSAAKTLLIDLSADDDAILAQCSKTTRYEIRRSAKEGMSVEFSIAPSVEQLERFCSFYAGFAAKKRRPPVDRARLFGLHGCGSLALSSVMDRDGTELVHHAYVVDNAVSRVMQLYAASHFRDYDDSPDRNKIARAHRYLCWMNIVSVKKLGFALYDFGGLPREDADRDLQQIAFFKRGFGGLEIVEYSGHVGLTIPGKIACMLR
jgi:hypothetical protein